MKKFKTEDIAFGQLTEQFIYDFQSYICDECDHEGSARHFLALLKKACKGAFKEGIAERQYFAPFSLPRKRETTPKTLSRETFERIRDLQIDPKHEGHILSRDMFLFACYTGVPYSDVVSVTDDNLSIDEDGNLKMLSLLIDFRGVPHSGNMRTNRLLNLFTMKKHKK